MEMGLLQPSSCFATESLKPRGLAGANATAAKPASWILSSGLFHCFISSIFACFGFRQKWALKKISFYSALCGETFGLHALCLFSHTRLLSVFLSCNFTFPLSSRLTSLCTLFLWAQLFYSIISWPFSSSLPSSFLPSVASLYTDFFFLLHYFLFFSEAF